MAPPRPYTDSQVVNHRLIGLCIIQYIVYKGHGMYAYRYIHTYIHIYIHTYSIIIRIYCLSIL